MLYVYRNKYYGTGKEAFILYRNYYNVFYKQYLLRCNYWFSILLTFIFIHFYFLQSPEVFSLTSDKNVVRQALLETKVCRDSIYS